MGEAFVGSKPGGAAPVGSGGGGNTYVVASCATNVITLLFLESHEDSRESKA